MSSFEIKKQDTQGGFVENHFWKLDQKNFEKNWEKMLFFSKNP